MAPSTRKRKAGAAGRPALQDSNNGNAKPTPASGIPQRYLLVVPLLGVDRVWAGFDDEWAAVAARRILWRQGLVDARVLVRRDVRVR